MRSLLSAVLPLLLAQAGCTVSAVGAADDPRPSNACTTDAECRTGQCSEGVCQTLNGQLEALLIAASPPSDSTIPHLTFVTHLEDVPTSGGAKDIVLLGPSHVIGSLTLPKGETCYPGFPNDDPLHPILSALDSKSLPVTVTLALHERLLGLPQQIYFATAASLNNLGHYAFDVQLPGGDYDVYLVPPKRQDGCAVPPQLYRGFTIDQANPEITFQLSGVSKLPLAIRWPKTSQPLTGWLVDIIEPVGGNSISTELVLGEPTEVGDSAVEYPAPLSYSTVVQPLTTTPVAADEGNDLLRLRPPVGVVAPTIFMDRSVLGLLTPPADRVVSKRFTSIPSAVQVRGQMDRGDTSTPVGGSLTLISTEIYGVDDGIFASYQTTVAVGDDGAIDVALPPGMYKVLAVPPVLGAAPRDAIALGSLEVIWDVPAEPGVQYGKLLELRPIAELSGQSPFQGAQVFAVPSPQTISPFSDAFGAGQFTPRATSGLVDEAGRFVVQADPGRFNLSVQAPDALGFAWFVRTGVDVGQHDQDLGRVVLPSPSLLSGLAGVSLVGGFTPLSSAVIRAYAYLDKNLAYTRDPKEAETVVQVAETRADENGAYRLLLPSRIDAPK